MWWNVHTSHCFWDDWLQTCWTAGCCYVFSCILFLFTVCQLLIRWWRNEAMPLQRVWCKCTLPCEPRSRRCCENSGLSVKYRILEYFFATVHRSDIAAVPKCWHGCASSIQVKAFIRKESNFLQSIWPAIRAEPPASGSEVLFSVPSLIFSVMRKQAMCSKCEYYYYFVLTWVYLTYSFYL